MKKFIRITFSNGEIYEVPAEIIATNRTQYYSENDNFEKDSPEWQSEFEYVMNDEYELTDWLVNNMDWSDIKEYAVLMEKSFDYDDDFLDCEKELVEHD